MLYIKKLVTMFVLIVFITGNISGCSSFYVKDATTGEDRVSNTVKDTASGTLWGAASGAVVGVIIGAIAGDAGKGAAIGALSGGVIGGASGYAKGYNADNLERQLGAELRQYGVQVKVNHETNEVYLIMGNRITFETNSYTVKQGIYPVLNAIRVVLKRYPGVSLSVVGHTDSVGTSASNYRLSVNRALSVKRALQEVGIVVPINTQGAGEDNPVESNATAMGRSYNRRVEITFVQPAPVSFYLDGLNEETVTSNALMFQAPKFITL